ncbi:Periodic tryptophan protein 1 [Nymphon striatum]|nr:Periodic tryptophan protein 1 [Nymphon striatum]
MNFIPCVTWIRRGVSKEIPDEVKLEKEDLKRILSGTAADIAELEIVDDNDNNSNEEEESNDEEVEEVEEKVKNDEISENDKEDDDDDFMEKYDLDNYDDPQNDADGDSFAHLKSVTCFASNDEDPYITVKEDESDEDEEDNKRIKPIDNLIVVGHVDQDTSVLEFHIYNEEEQQLYIHHDILLPAYPLCVEWLDYDPDDESPGNFIAVGSMLPQIDIWDIDIVNTLEPSFTLGKKKKKKKNSNKKSKPEGHTDAVLALSWNKIVRNVLASGSADFRALLWDLQTKKCVTKIKDHKEKVQTLQFHPFEAQTLLTGSCDSSQKRKVPENGDVSRKTARCSAQQVAAILDSDDEETLCFDEDYMSDELETDSDDNFCNDNDSERDSDNENPADNLPVRPVIAHNLDSGWNKKTAKLFDCRNTSQGAKSWSFNSEVEKVLWNHFDPYHFLVSTDTGLVHYMDVRSEVPVFDIKAHSESITGLSLSNHCPGCLMTVSTDQSFKVWDIFDSQPECILEHDFRLGQMYCLSTCPDNPFVIASGGDNKENNFVVWDIRQFDSVVKRFGDRNLVEVDLFSKVSNEQKDQMDVDCDSSSKISEINGT